MLSVNSWDESLEFVQKGRERLRAKLKSPLFCPFFFGPFFSFAACSILLYVRIILYVPTFFLSFFFTLIPCTLGLCSGCFYFSWYGNTHNRRLLFPVTLGDITRGAAERSSATWHGGRFRRSLLFFCVNYHATNFSCVHANLADSSLQRFREHYEVLE